MRFLRSQTACGAGLREGRQQLNEMKGVNRVAYDITSKPAGCDRVEVSLRGATV
jgi:hypothetical protein